MLGGAKHLADGGDVLDADGFAVPARALGVDFAVGLFVGFGCPFEGRGEGFFVDFVVVVDVSLWDG